MQTRNIMVDLECLSTGVERDAVVLSVALVKFDPFGSDDWGSMDHPRSTYIELPCTPQESEGRTIAFDTVRCWMERSKDAQKPFRNAMHVNMSPDIQRIELEQSLHHLTSFMSNYNYTDEDKPFYLWAKPAHFDCPILYSLCKDFNVPFPIPWWNYRCMHTLQAMCKTLNIHSPEITYKGVAHNALDDAKQQVLELQGWFRQLKSLRSSGI